MSTAGAPTGPGPVDAPPPYVRPSQRAEWAGVAPVPQPKGSGLVEIDYEPLFAEVHDYFRYVFLNEEYGSER